jgi:antitoxin component of MazEF toxin-antitoxin module
MRSHQKLVRNGNSTQVTIPRPILTHLGWLPGEMIVVELLEDKSLRVFRYDQHGENMRSTRPIVVQSLAEATR